MREWLEHFQATLDTSTTTVAAITVALLIALVAITGVLVYLVGAYWKD